MSKRPPQPSPGRQLPPQMRSLDEIVADRIYARHAYWADEIVWNRRFVDVISATPNGRRVVDLTRFHDTVSI